VLIRPGIFGKTVGTGTGPMQKSLPGIFGALRTRWRIPFIPKGDLRLRPLRRR